MKTDRFDPAFSELMARLAEDTLLVPSSILLSDDTSDHLARKFRARLVRENPKRQRRETLFLDICLLRDQHATAKGP